MCARKPTSFWRENRRDSRRIHSARGFRENVAVSETSYQMLEVLSFCDSQIGAEKSFIKKEKKGETEYVAQIKEVIFAFVSKFKTVLDCGLYALDSGFFVSKFSFGIPDSLSCSLDSVAQDFGFQKQKLLDCRIRIPLQTNSSWKKAVK